MVTRRWSVEPYGYTAEVFEAPTKGAARWAAYVALSSAYPMTFREFLARGVTVMEVRNGCGA